ncbi:MAG: Rho termination factor [Rhodospirillales bacterium]|nr:Rho termination factor [Rhodospirillales bacterium]
MVKDHGPQIKDDATYEALRGKGMTKEKAVRIANAKADPDREDPSRKGGRQPAYEEWTRDELYDHARNIGIERRSSMSKEQLIDALRNH